MTTAEIEPLKKDHKEAGPADANGERTDAAPEPTLAVIALASFVLMVTMGIRQTAGLFVQPITRSRGIGIVEISMALAVGQLIWGVFQPVFGAWADKKSAFSALLAGVLCLAAGQIGAIWAGSVWSLTLTLGILSPIGAAAGSFPVLIGLAAARLPSDKRSMASGFINAGGSAGQFAFAPIVQYVMNLRGYGASLMMLAGFSFLSLIPSRILCNIKIPYRHPARSEPSGGDATALSKKNLGEQIRVALRNPSYILLHAGFFTCGFHVAFLTTHLPGEIGLHGHSAAVSAANLSVIGLCNIVGSIGAGALGKYFRMKYILAFFYASRALLTVAYLLAPKTETTFYLFAAATGLTWLATVPPTSGLVGKLFGTRYLATLFGLTLLSHQIGAFFGAWLGGLALQNTGNLLWVWYADAALALMAALVNLPINEPRV
jgi:predicted MFS family arabinose efflux permease